MMKKRVGVLLGVLVLAGGCVGTHRQVERAVTAAMAPEKPASVWTKEMPSFANASSDPAAMNTAIADAMGRDSFTCWMITQPAPQLEELEWEFSHGGGGVATYLGKHHTLVRRKDITGLTWAIGKDDSISGTFQVKTPYGLEAAFVFLAEDHAGELEISHLAIQKRGSVEIAEGYTVFRK